MGRPLLISYNTVIDDYGSASGSAPSTCGPCLRMADLPYFVPDYGDDLDAEDEYIFLIEDLPRSTKTRPSVGDGYPIMQQLGVRTSAPST